tara:strand:+ start:272 stop:538 length:267 start_codon:yes stop_codon:yes gene_type:complete
MAGFGITKAPKYGKAVASWVKGKLSPKTTPDKSPFDLAKSELNIAKAKGKSIDKLAKDVKENIPMFKEGKAFKEGLGKFGFNKSGKKK